LQGKKRREQMHPWTSPEIMDTPEKGNTMYLGVASDDTERQEAVQQRVQVGSRPAIV
jgi:hypothetical protein